MKDVLCLLLVLLAASHAENTIYVKLSQTTAGLLGTQSVSCGSASNPCSTLQAGVDASSDGDRVLVVGSDVSATHECSVDVKHSLTLEAESGVTLECSGMDASRPAMVVTLKASAGNAVPFFVLHNFTIAGSSSGALDVRVDANTDCSVVFQSCSFTSNSISKDRTTRNYVSAVALSNTGDATSTVASDTTTSFSLKIDNCSFEGNAASGDSVQLGAGALAVWWSKPRDATFSVTNSHFANNSADLKGSMANGGAGAIAVNYLCNSDCKQSNQNMEFELSNSTWEDNWSTVGSGAVKVLVQSMTRGNVSHNSFKINSCTFRRNVLSWPSPQPQENDGSAGAFCVTNFVAGGGPGTASNRSVRLPNADLSGTYAFYNSFSVTDSEFTENKCLANREVAGDSFGAGTISVYWNSNVDVQTSHNDYLIDSCVFQRNMVNTSTDSGSNAAANIVVYYDATFTEYGRSHDNHHNVSNCSFVDSIIFVTSGKPDGCSIGEDMAAAGFVAYYHTGQNAGNVYTLTGNEVHGNHMTSTGRSYMNAAVPFAATYINCNNFPGVDGANHVGVCPHDPPDYRCQSSAKANPPTFVLADNNVHDNTVKTDDDVKCFQYWSQSTDGGYVVSPCE